MATQTTEGTKVLSMHNASKAIKAIARQAQYDSKRDTGYSEAIGFDVTAQGGAIIHYADGTCETITARDLEDVAKEID